MIREYFHCYRPEFKELAEFADKVLTSNLVVTAVTQGEFGALCAKNLDICKWLRDDPVCSDGSFLFAREIIGYGWPEMPSTEYALVKWCAEIAGVQSAIAENIKQPVSAWATIDGFEVVYPHAYARLAGYDIDDQRWPCIGAKLKIVPIFGATEAQGASETQTQAE